MRPQVGAIDRNRPSGSSEPPLPDQIAPELGNELLVRMVGGSSRRTPVYLASTRDSVELEKTNQEKRNAGIGALGIYREPKRKLYQACS